MTEQLILSSGSRIRAELLRNAGVEIITELPRIDEDTIKQAMQVEGMNPRDIADALAEAKAKKVSGRHPGNYRGYGFPGEMFDAQRRENTDPGFYTAPGGYRTFQQVVEP